MRMQPSTPLRLDGNMHLEALRVMLHCAEHRSKQREAEWAQVVLARQLRQHAKKRLRPNTLARQRYDALKPRVLLM